MDQEKFGKLIKDIRKKNNLTQKELADKYGVTYQAVSKWENGKNMPDITLIKEISKDFNISLDKMFDNSIKKKKNIFIIIAIILILIIVIIVLILKNNNDFSFNTLESVCSDFTISGSIAYNKNKSSIYITNITYCGDVEEIKYQSIECILYESNNNIEQILSSYSIDEEITLEEFLKQVTFTIDSYESICSDYNNSLYMVINAIDSTNKITSYNIPLTLNEC